MQFLQQHYLEFLALFGGIFALIRFLRRKKPNIRTRGREHLKPRW